MKLYEKVMMEMMDKYKLSPSTKIAGLQYKMTAEDYEKLLVVMKYPNGIVRDLQPSDFTTPVNNGICDCGKPIPECKEAYEHMTQGF